MSEGGKLISYDLYALGKNPEEISFGARFGNEHTDYITGFAIRKGLKDYDLFGALPVMVAIARYFAMKMDEFKWKLDRLTETEKSPRNTPHKH